MAFGSGWVGEEKSGSSSWELLQSLEGEGVVPGLPVLIYASSTTNSGILTYHRPGYITFVGELAHITRANITGKHPHPELRPRSAHLRDTPAAVFWEVSHLRHLSRSEQISYGKLKRVAGQRGKGVAITTYPRGPTRVLVPEEFKAILNHAPTNEGAG